MGDSVLLGTKTTLPPALPGWQVTMDCAGSRRLAQAIGEIRARRGEIGRVFVVQLGNNFLPGEGAYGDQIDQAMAELAGVERVVWITVAEVSSSRVQINADIRAAAGRHPSMVVAEWAPLIAANPGYAADALHLSASGREAMTRLIADTLGPAPA
jgi:hypothetical protein